MSTDIVYPVVWCTGSGGHEVLAGVVDVELLGQMTTIVFCPDHDLALNLLGPVEVIREATAEEARAMGLEVVRVDPVTG